MYSFDMEFEKQLYVSLDPDYHKSCEELEIIVYMNFTTPNLHTQNKSFPMEYSSAGELTCVFMPDKKLGVTDYQKWLLQFSN